MWALCQFRDGIWLLRNSVYQLSMIKSFKPHQQHRVPVSRFTLRDEGFLVQRISDVHKGTPLSTIIQGSGVQVSL